MAPDLGFIQINPHTVEVVLPFDEFIDEVQVIGGFGSAADHPWGVVSLDDNGLDSRVLMHLRDFPASAVVPGGGTDSVFTVTGGRVLLRFDTLVGTLLQPVNVDLFAVAEDWHTPSVTWEVAVDTASDRTAWTQPGGGVLTSIGSAVFDIHRAQTEEDAAFVDTVSVPLDSAAAADLADPSSGVTGILLAVADPGSFVYLLDAAVVFKARPSIEPDSIMELTVENEDLTFMLDPQPAPPGGALRVGGTPSWRSIITMSIPRMVDGTPEVCGAPGCQVDLGNVVLNAAELILTTRQTQSPFEPQDTTRMDLREVLKPELLPKSPLGGALSPIFERLEPDLFSDQAGTTVFLALTNMVREILATSSGTETEFQVTIALLSVIEPDQVGFATFEGAGSAGAPALRLLYTVANDVGLP
jgi:hypothetical protein